MEYERIFARYAARQEDLTDEEIDSPSSYMLGVEGVNPTPELLAWAENKSADLNHIKTRRQSRIQAVFDQLDGLWRRLGVTDDEAQAFMEAQRGTTEGAVRAYEEELERMLELKREKMSTFVENARDEIRKLWDELMVGEEERADFAPFADGELPLFDLSLFNSYLIYSHILNQMNTPKNYLQSMRRKFVV